jgi:hypothetical protein
MHTYAYSIASTNHMRSLDRLESVYVDHREMRSALHTTIFKNYADLALLSVLYTRSKCFYSLFLLRSSSSSIFSQLKGSRLGISAIEDLIDFLERQLAVRSEPSPC